jgi:hypothetical protein
MVTAVDTSVLLDAQRLLVRDRGYYRDYFKQLQLWDPTALKNMIVSSSLFVNPLRRVGKRGQAGGIPLPSAP